MNKKNTIPEALISANERHNKRRTDTKNGKVRRKGKNQNDGE